MSSFTSCHHKYFWRQELKLFDGQRDKVHQYLLTARTVFYSIITFSHSKMENLVNKFQTIRVCIWFVKFVSNDSSYRAWLLLKSVQPLLFWIQGSIEITRKSALSELIVRYWKQNWKTQLCIWLSSKENAGNNIKRHSFIFSFPAKKIRRLFWVLIFVNRFRFRITFPIWLKWADDFVC